MHVCDMAEALGATSWPGVRPGGYRYPSTNTKHVGSVILIPGTDRPGSAEQIGSQGRQLTRDSYSLPSSAR